MTPNKCDTTCGARYRALVDRLFPSLGDSHGLDELIVRCPQDPPGYACFAIGFMAGQAEKVASGACPAFMIRPAPAWWMWTQHAMRLVCRHYGLLVYPVDSEAEVWGCADMEVLANLKRALRCERNSEAWHDHRAVLCGIPWSKIDLYY